MDEAFRGVDIVHLATDQGEDHSDLDEMVRAFLPIIQGHTNDLVDM